MESISNFIYVIIAAFFVMFAPGLFISFLFFDFNELDLIERIALAFALSISVVPLLTFYLNLLGSKISLALVIFEVILICSISTLIYVFKNYYKNQR
jgi:uncharacterized membrane protein